MNSKEPSFFERMGTALKRSITLRLVSIGILILILLIPNAMVSDLIYERNRTAQNAINEVSDSWAGRQDIIGPILALPYDDIVVTNGTLKTTRKHLHILPDDLLVNGNISPKKLNRGIYEVVVYNTEIDLSGSIKLPDLSKHGIAQEDVLWEEAFVSIGLGDQSGIKDYIKIDWAGKNIDMEPGVPVRDVISKGLTCRVPLDTSDLKKNYLFQVNLDLNGSQGVQVYPTGKITEVKFTSEWPDPSFVGAFLPDKRKVTEKGFIADWKVIYHNRGYPQAWKEKKYSIANSSFGVNLLLPVDQYQKSTRTNKYALLLIVLVFTAFFFVELLLKLRFHPIQYFLVGLALVLFYLLLLSISEHLSFNLAYVISAAAILSLVTFYIAGMFKNAKLTAFISASLTFFYAFVFVVLQLQELALLMGSILLFIVLAAVMVLSKRINLNGPEDPEPLESEPQDVNEELP